MQQHDSFATCMITSYTSVAMRGAGSPFLPLTWEYISFTL